MKTISIDIKTVYGTERIYPREYEWQIKRLTGKATIQRQDLAAWRTLGIEFSTSEASEVLA